MEKNLSINISTDERQVLSIQSKELNLKICENSNEMMLDELVIDTHKKLKIHAKNFVHNEADQEDLAQQTILKILNNEATKEKFAKSNTPVAFAQKILKNLFIDEYRKNKRLVPLEDKKIESMVIAVIVIKNEIGLLKLGSQDRTRYLGDEDTTFIQYIRDVLEVKLIT